LRIQSQIERGEIEGKDEVSFTGEVQSTNQQLRSCVGLGGENVVLVMA
jgi:hypothetical protein